MLMMPGLRPGASVPPASIVTGPADRARAAERRAGVHDEGAGNRSRDEEGAPEDRLRPAVGAGARERERARADLLEGPGAAQGAGERRRRVVAAHRDRNAPALLLSVPAPASEPTVEPFACTVAPAAIVSGALLKIRATRAPAFTVVAPWWVRSGPSAIRPPPPTVREPVPLVPAFMVTPKGESNSRAALTMKADGETADRPRHAVADAKRAAIHRHRAAKRKGAGQGLGARPDLLEGPGAAQGAGERRRRVVAAHPDRNAPRVAVERPGTRERARPSSRLPAPWRPPRS